MKENLDPMPLQSVNKIKRDVVMHDQRQSYKYDAAIIEQIMEDRKRMLQNSQDSQQIQSVIKFEE